MKKLILLFALISTLLVGCKKEESKNYPPIIGSWSDVSITNGDYLSSKLELTWTFSSNNTGNTRIMMTVNDKLIRDYSSPFNYDYKGSYIIIKTKEETLNYNINVSGNKMRLGNEEKGYFNLIKK